jgi:hypothetical protein
MECGRVKKTGFLQKNLWNFLACDCKMDRWKEENPERFGQKGIDNRNL